MTQEEKAKAYDRVSKEVKDFFEGRQKMYNDVSKTLEYLFPELSESEDERTRKELMDFVVGNTICKDGKREKYLAWLEKQKAKEDLDRMAPIYEDKESFESALEKVWEFYNNSGARTVDSCEDNYVECAYAKGFREGFLFGLKRHESVLPNVKEEQKPADKVNPKFKVGNVMRTLEEADGNITSGLPVIVFVDNEYYHCTNELIAIKDQDNYEYPPMNSMQEPTDKVEPKFKVGNFIVNNNNGTVFQVTKISDDKYCMSHLYDNFEEYMSITDIDKYYHLWTIEDAKEGDVIAGRFGIFIFKGKIYGYCGLLSDDTFITSTGNNEWTRCLHPATNAQRDLLFVKMMASGYKWNDQEKRLERL